MPNEQLLYSEEAALILRALDQSSQPLTVKKLEKAIPKSSLKSKKRLPELLRQMVKAGQIRSGKARSMVYWLPSLESQASDRILDALSELPLTQTELKNKLRSLLIGWPKTNRNEILDRLIKEKRVYKVAPLTGKARLLSARAEPTPQDYIKLALQLAVAKLKPMGFTTEQVFTETRKIAHATPRPANPAVPSVADSVADLEKLILERMLQLNPAVTTGAPVQLSELRQALHSEVADKDIFDQTILRLAEQGRVAVHRHDYVSSLSPVERAALVSDGLGNYFIGITLRA